MNLKPHDLSQQVTSTYCEYSRIRDCTHSWSCRPYRFHRGCWCEKSFCNPQLLVRTAATPNSKRCRLTRVNSSTTAPVVMCSSNRRQATVACSAHTAPCRVPRFRSRLRTSPVTNAKTLRKYRTAEKIGDGLFCQRMLPPPLLFWRWWRCLHVLPVTGHT